MDPRHGYGREIDAIEAADVDGPQVWRGAGPAERQNTAHRAEVVRRRTRVPLVQGQILERRQQTEVRCFDAVVQGAALATETPAVRRFVTR